MTRHKQPGRPTKQEVMERAKKQIMAGLDNLGQRLNRRVFLERDIKKLLNLYQKEGVLHTAIRLKEFKEFILENNLLTEVEVEVPFGSGKQVKYTLGEVSEFEIALSIRSGSYLSHYSAIYLHGLTDNIPQVIYINKEQSKKPKPKGVMLQENLDRAFSRPMRKTNKIAKHKGYKIYLLNGKYTGNLGVIDYPYGQVTIPVTGIERTLIDAVVRPDYAGGIEEVLKAFVAAKEEISVNKLVATLKKMGYVYPYHQVIGFYLEKAGYKESVLKLVEELGIEYKFYLTYEMRDVKFNDRWNLYVPKRL